MDIARFFIPIIEGGLNRAYQNLVLNTQPSNLIQYLPMNEQSGTVAKDLSIQSNAAAYSNAVLYQNGFVSGEKSVYFNGTNSFINLYTTGFRDDFNGAEGSITIGAKLDEAWSETTERYLIRLYKDGSNTVRIRKSNSNRITFEYAAGGTIQTRVLTLSDTGFFTVGVTWSASNDRLRFFYNGVQLGADITGLGTWSGSLVSTICVIGAASTGAAALWKGWVARYAIWKAELTLPEMLAIGTGVNEVPEIHDGFSVVVMPDPQNYAAYNPFEYYAQTQWIVNNQVAYNIQAALCVGDLVDTCSTAAQWVVADAAFDILDVAEIPYLAGIGNHDWDSAKDATTFNANFPTTRYSTHDWWVGGFKDAGHSENGYFTLTIGATDYIFISIEDIPPAAAITWLDGLLTTHSAKKAIIITHAYLGTINAGINNTRDATGDAIWAVAKLHDNVIWIQNGHVINNGYGRLVSLSDGGKEVNQILANYQSEDGATGGSGYLRLVTFEAAGGKIYTQTFSPTRQKLKRDDNHQFVLNYPA